MNERRASFGNQPRCARSRLGFGVATVLLFGTAFFFATEQQAIKVLQHPGALGLDQFGFAVSISNDTALVGAFADEGPLGELNPGSAFVFEKSLGGTDNWGLAKQLMASDAAPNDQFGVAVALDTDTAVIGAFADGGMDTGSAYVFERDHGGTGNWGEIKKLNVDGLVANAFFGRAVAVNGDTIAVSAYTNQVGAALLAGNVYIFSRNLGGTNAWGLAKTLAAPVPVTNGQFGWDVSISGDTLLVAELGTGQVLFFERNLGGTDAWGFSTAVAGSGLFAWSAKVHGDTAVVGAITTPQTAGSTVLTGSAYILERSLGWGVAKQVMASDGEHNDQFGISVDIESDTIVVGAFAEDATGVDSGSAYYFSRNQGGAGNWGEVSKLVGSPNTDQHWMGFASATTATRALVGAPHNNLQPTTVGGFAYVFDLVAGPSADPTGPGWVLDGFGGLHAGGGAAPLNPATVYFGFDIAVDLELASTGFYVLDGFGGVHAGGGASPMVPATPYFGFDVAADLELASTGYYLLDRMGGVHAGGGAPILGLASPYFGFDVARDLELTSTGLSYYVLDGFGGVHSGGGAPVLSPATPYFGQDVAVDLELASTGYYVLDSFGGVHSGGGAPLLTPATPYFGFDVARDLELASNGYYALDGFGGVHSGGGAPAMVPATTYLGFDIARDLELQ